jgi:hypothetical protein
MQTLVALYPTFEKAQHTVDELVRNGVSREQISIVASDASGRYAKEYKLNDTAADPTEDAVTAGQGVAFGAAAGGLMGVLVGLGTFALPGIGPVIGAGPLVAALTGGVLGAAAGAPTGGIVAALVKTNTIDQIEAEAYEEGIRRGNTLLTVESDDLQHMKVREILKRHDPIDVRTQPDQDLIDTAANGMPIAPHKEPNFESLERSLRANYEQLYATSGRTYDEYRLIYRYGYEVATSPVYIDRDWAAIEPELRQAWEKQNPQTPWDRFSEAVRYAWEQTNTALHQPA